MLHPVFVIIFVYHTLSVGSLFTEKFLGPAPKLQEIYHFENTEMQTNNTKTLQWFQGPPSDSSAKVVSSRAILLRAANGASTCLWDHMASPGLNTPLKN